MRTRLYLQNIFDPLYTVPLDEREAFRSDLQKSCKNQIKSIFSRQTFFQHGQRTLWNWRPHFIRQISRLASARDCIMITDLFRAVYCQSMARFFHFLKMKRAAYACALSSLSISRCIDQCTRQDPYEPIQRVINQPAPEQALFLASLSKLGLLHQEEYPPSGLEGFAGNPITVLSAIPGLLATYLPLSSQMKEHIIASTFWQPYGINGICQGMSLWFLQLCSEALSKDTSTSRQEIVRKIAQSFAWGGNQEAFILQFIPNNHKEIFNNLPLQIHIHSMQIWAPKSSLESPLKEAMSYGKVLESLDEGMYFLSIPGSCPKIRHAIALVKFSQKETYIFDPNQGLIACLGDNPNDLFAQYICCHISKSLLNCFEYSRKRLEKHFNLEPQHYTPFYIRCIPCSSRDDSKIFPDLISNQFRQEQDLFFPEETIPLGNWQEIDESVYGKYNRNDGNKNELFSPQVKYTAAT